MHDEPNPTWIAPQSPLPDDAAQSHATVSAERLRADITMLCELVDLGIQVDGEAVEIEGARWIIYGRSSYDGAMILAEYDDPDEAAAVLRAIPTSRSMES